MKKKLPEFRMIIDNQEYFKLTISLIFYSIYFSSSSTDSFKIAEYFSIFINNIFNIDVSKLMESLYDHQKLNGNTKFCEINSTNKNELNGNSGITEKNEHVAKDFKNKYGTEKNIDLEINSDKDLKYLEVLEQLKSKNIENFDLDKYYKMDKIANLICFKKGR